MRKTLVLSVERELVQFMETQQGLVDPSALINKLFHEDMQRKGFKPDSNIKSKLQQDEVLQELELLADEDAFSAE